MVKEKNKNERIMSIDALRGFDMLMIIAADQFFIKLHQGANTPLTGFLAEQFDHPDWYGFHFYDIIMPLFLFVVGAVIPFSLGKRKGDKDNSSLYKHFARRFVILFILGWIVQGNLLELDVNTFKFYSNTLQAIAVGYIFSVFAYLKLSKNSRYFMFLACLVIYAAILAWAPVPGLGNSELLPDKNIAIYIDHLIFGRFDDKTQYTWLLTGLGFTATTLSGLFAGELVKSELSREKVLKQLIIVGIFFIVLGQVWGIWHPIIKKLWTSSFVLFLSGICFLLLALFYWIVDVKGNKKWAFSLKVIGMNAITAYVLSHVINFPDIANNVLFGFEKYAGNYYEMLTVLGGFGILYWLLWFMYKNKTFIKI